jgi:hypothetical protein
MEEDPTPAPFTSDKIVMVRVDDIKVGDRFRQDLGDIEGLAESIKRNGLLQPIGITSDNKLVYGERRWRAFKFLGRDEIPAIIIDVDQLRAEYDENLVRKAFTLTERVAIADAIAAKEVATSGEDRINDTRHPEGDGDRPKVLGTASAHDREIAQIAAQKSGLGSREQYRKAKQVIEAARSDAARFGHLSAKMDATGKVDPAWKEMRSLQGHGGKTLEDRVDRRRSAGSGTNPTEVELREIWEPLSEEMKRQLVMWLFVHGQIRRYDGPNLRAEPETADQLYKIAKRAKKSMSKLLEQAVPLLEAELANEQTALPSPPLTSEHTIAPPAPAAGRKWMPRVLSKRLSKEG